MKRHLLILICVACACMACERGYYRPEDGDKRVVLSASVASTVESRAAYSGVSTKDMEATVWLSTRRGVFADNPTPVGPNFLPYRAQVKYLDNSTTIYVDPENKLNPITYPLDPEKSEQPLAYCVGLYPATGWTSDDGRVAKHAIDGHTDIMFAEQLQGSWVVPFPMQVYRHLLSWIKIEARVTDVEAIDHWGKIQEIRIVNPHTTMQIAFDQAAPVGGQYHSTITYTGDSESLDVFTDATGLALSVTPMELGGDLLCAPSKEVTLSIKTTTAERTITVPLKDVNGNVLTDADYLSKAVGKLFIVNLYFAPFKDIDATCSLIPWNEQNVDLS